MSDIAGAGLLVLAMEYCPGGSLNERLLAGGPLALDEALRLGQELCAGLEAIHGTRAVHRDLKPANVLLGADGHWKIADLGLAQSPRGVSMRSQFSSATGALHPGTALYKSPEQERESGYLLPTSDVFALGCVLFEALSGEVYKTVYGARLRELRPDAPEWLEEAIARMVLEAPGRLPADEADGSKRYR